MKMNCTMCPMGCEMTVSKLKSGYSVKGNNCKRGEIYALQEITAPKRVVTAILKTRDSGVLSVKTTDGVPKEKVMSVIKEIAKLKVISAKLGDVVITNVLNTGVNVVVTSNKIE